MKVFGYVALGAWSMALLDSLAALLGFWSITQEHQRGMILALETMVMLILFANSATLRHWLLVHSQDLLARRVAMLCMLSLAVCIGGDIENFNLPQTYFRHGDVVKHDYLADSVMYFAPGYALLLAAVLMVVRARGVSWRTVTWVAVMSGLLGLLSFASMVLPNTGDYVAGITGAYSVLITWVGASAWLLLLAFGGWREASPLVRMVAFGLLLATVADAVIGSFWIYGNDGLGFFPVAREVNWIIYVGSQALVMQLPRLLIKRA